MDTIGTSTNLFVGGTFGNSLYIWSEHYVAWEECGFLPGYLLCMSERYYHLVHHFVRANSAAEKTHLETRRVVASEDLAIETIKLFPTNATCRG